MQVISLQSGSNGNCTYVEAGSVRLLFDAGISGVQAERRLAARGRDIRQVDAVLISHDHADHARCLGVYRRKFGLPVWVSGPTLEASARHRIGAIDDARHFGPGDTLRLGGVSVETYRTPHDAADGVAFVVDDGRRRLGILTDLGHAFSGLDALLGSLNAVLLESNYDPDMLDAGDYPAWLKHRIRGPGGHLSNLEAAELLAHYGRRLAWACLGHLSEDNNTPRMALAAHRRLLGDRLPLHLAGRYDVSAVMAVE